MIRTIFLLFMLLPVVLQAQSAIGKNREEVLKEIQDNSSEISGTAYTASGAAYTTTNDSNSISWRITAGAQSLERYYLFDSSGRCKIEKWSTGDNEIFQKLLREALKNKKYRWKEINLNQHVSKYSKGLLLEVQAISNVFSLSFIKTNLTKETYKMLLGKKRLR